MTDKFNKEQRRNIALRRLIVTGNCLSLWAGRIPESTAEHVELEELFNAWENAIDAIRQFNVQTPGTHNLGRKNGTAT